MAPFIFSILAVLQPAVADEAWALSAPHVGMSLIAKDERGIELRLRLEDVQLMEHGGLAYGLWIVDEHGLRPLCDTSNAGANFAVPLKGTWDEAGHWHADGLTMACEGGTLAKCVRWGYVPWKSKRGRDLRPYYQACLRLVRADYCGDGRGHTQDGTPINIWDDLDIMSRDAVPGMTFEAAWTPDGAVGIRQTRYPASMDYVRQNCPERLADEISLNGDKFPLRSALLWSESYRLR